MKTCYVSTPYGVRQAPDGRTIDFDQIYREVIKPAVALSGLDVVRLDESPAGSLIHKTLFSLILGSDLMIADLSTSNANVLYELGLRHATRRARTLLVMARGTQLPFNVSQSYAIRYDLDPSGRLLGVAADRLRDELTAAIRDSQERITSDSPLYEFFPELRVELPPSVAPEQVRRTYPRRVKEVIVRGAIPRSPEEASRDVREAQQELRSAPEADPYAHLDLIRRARDAGDWEGVVTLAREAPPIVARATETRQQLALALNRLGQFQPAIDVIKDLIAETGGDAESFGILGRLWKDQFEQEKRGAETDPAKADPAKIKSSHEHALSAYREAFARNPTDIYAAVNVARLVAEGEDSSTQFVAADMLRQVRAMQSGPGATRDDAWMQAAVLELAVLARDWPSAQSAVEGLVSMSAEPFAIRTAARQLDTLRRGFSGDDGDRLRQLIERLQSGSEAGGRYA